MRPSVLTRRRYHSGRRQGFLANLIGAAKKIRCGIRKPGKIYSQIVHFRKAAKSCYVFAMRKTNPVVRAFGQIGGQLKHPAAALVCALVLGYAAIPVGWTAFDQAQQFTSDDPATISDRALDGVFDRAVAEREIKAALAAGDLDMAQSFVDLSGERGVVIAPTLGGQLKEAQTDAASA